MTEAVADAVALADAVLEDEGGLRKTTFWSMKTNFFTAVKSTWGL